MRIKQFNKDVTSNNPCGACLKLRRSFISRTKKKKRKNSLNNKTGVMYSEQQLAERYADIHFIAPILEYVKKLNLTEPKPCEGHGFCWFYGYFDCDSCIAANRIYEYFEEKNKANINSERKK